MALPGDLTICTVSFGPYTDAAGVVVRTNSKGEPITGKLFPVNPVNGNRIKLVHVATGQAILPNVLPILIGDDGTATVGPIPHTDNAGLSTVGFAYRVEWDLQSGDKRPSPGNKTFAVPTAAGATADFDLLDVAEAVPGVLVPIGEGPQGDAGLTAYEVAVAEGFVGTEAAWLASLKGEQGDPGDPSVTPEAVAANLPARLSEAELRAASVAAVEDAAAVAPTGAWDFAEAPTVAGVPIGGSSSVTASQITDSTTVGRSVLTAATATAARTAIGAGTSSTKADVGLGNVDNTTDANKPVSTAQQTALNAKAPLTGVEGTKVHDGTAGGGVRPTGYARVRWIGGTARPTNMVAGDIWEHDA